MQPRERNTKIIATLGPKSSTLATIEQLFLNGADVFRLNFSHGSHKTHGDNIAFIREVEKKYDRPIGILADLQGPKLRIGTFEKGNVILKKGDTFTFVQNGEQGDETHVNLPHPEIFQTAIVGMDLLLDDGKIRLRVMHVTPTILETEIIVGGSLSDHKGVNVPGVLLPISAITEKDRADIDFILTQDIDWVALSFVQTKDDIVQAKKLIGSHAKIAAKLEKPLALDHLNDIVDVSDAIMVARGDLGVELPPENVPVIQKRIIRACRMAGKPVIVATQMLESMIHCPTPTRAEASDIANAIYDHVDAVMLSAESASGDYPAEAVSMMNRVILSTEKDIISDHKNFKLSSHETISDAITAAAREITELLNIKVIVTLTASGLTTYAAAKERPRAHIIAITNHKKVARELSLCWGVYGVYTVLSYDDLNKNVVPIVKKISFVSSGDKIIITSGIPFKVGSTNYLRIEEIE